MRFTVSYILFTLLVLFNIEECKCATSTKKYTYYSGELGKWDLEIDLPENYKEPTPYIIYIHGGGWQHGDLDVFKKHSLYMANKGIAGIRISYPLIRDNGNIRRVLFLIDELISFINKHENEWNLDSSKFGFCGASAGAHIASLASMRVKGCRLFIGMSGCYNLLNTIDGNFPNKFLKEKFIQAVDSIDLKKASAIYNIPDRNIPNCLLMHGTNDNVISYLQSKEFAEAIIQKGGYAETIIYDGVDHGTNSRTNEKLFLQVSNDMFVFCNKIFSRKRIACVGNSITYGYLTNSINETYPYKLQKKLGDEYEVRNFGVPGAAVQFDKLTTYLKTQQYKEVKSFKPDIIILKLGTNDSRYDEWTNKRFFYDDYIRLIWRLKNITKEIYLCYPIPPYGPKWKERDYITKNRVIKLIRKISKKEKLPIIDLYHINIKNEENYYPDGIHPTEKGYDIITEKIYSIIK